MSGLIQPFYPWKNPDLEDLPTDLQKHKSSGNVAGIMKSSVAGTDMEDNSSEMSIADDTSKISGKISSKSKINNSGVKSGGRTSTTSHI